MFCHKTARTENNALVTRDLEFTKWRFCTIMDSQAFAFSMRFDESECFFKSFRYTTSSTFFFGQTSSSTIVLPF